MQFKEECPDGHIWDKPWSTEKIRENSQSWALAGDSGLLNKLQDMAQTLVSQTHQIQQEVNALVQETEGTHSRLHNIVNDFLMLSNTQFVESRVYDEEVISSPSTESKKNVAEKKTKEEKDAEVIAKVAKALHFGITVIDVAYEQLELQNSDSEEESEPYRHEPILHPKERYGTRPLPCIIGSQQFLEDDHLGLGGSLSEDEMQEEVSSISSEESPSPSRKENLDNVEKLVTNKRDYEKDDSDDSRHSDIFNANEDQESSTHLPSDEDDDFMSPKKNFEKELAAKLKDPHKKISADAMSNSSGSSVNEEIKGRSIKQLADSHRNRKGSSTSNYSSGSRKNEETRRKKVNVQPEQESKEEEEDDDDDDSELFGNKRGMFSSQGGLFDEDINEDDLFSGPTVSKHSTSHVNKGNLFTSSIESTDSGKDSPVKSNTSQQKASTQAHLFLDESEENDMFKIPVNNDKKSVSKQRSIFDEDDEGGLFESKVEANEEVATPKKKIFPGAVPMFGTAINPMSFKIQPQHSKESEKDPESDNVSQASLSNRTASVDEIKKDSPNNSGSSSSTAIFTDGPEDDDLFSAPIIPQKKSNTGGLLFRGTEDDDDFEDIFADKPKQRSSAHKSIDTEQKTMPNKSSKSLLFVEDQYDLFAEITKPKDKELTGNSLFKEEKDNSSASENISKSKENQILSTEKVKPQPKASLFDNEESTVDLFGEVTLSQSSKSDGKNTQLSQTRPRGKSLFEDEDLLFGTVPTENPEVDLFGSIGQTSKMKGGAKKTDGGEKLVSEESEPSIMTSTKPVSKLFDENDEEDLFAKSAISDKVATPKPLPSPRKQLRQKERGSNKDSSSSEDQGVSDRVTSSQSSQDVPSVTDSPRKKPIGGVALFGGMMPPLLKHPRSHSPVSNDVPSENAEAVTERTSMPKQGAFILFPTGTEGPTGISKTEPEVAVSFDDPIDANPLHNANKERIKIPVKRRLPTRRARQEAIRKSAIDMPTDNSGLLQADFDGKMPSVSAPTSPISPDSSQVIGFLPVNDFSNKLGVDTARIASIASPSTEEEDLFSIGDPIHQRFQSQPKDSKNSSTAKLDLNSVSSSSKASEGKDLFGGSSDDGEADDLFKPKPKTRTNLSSKKLSPRPSPKPERKSDARAVADIDKNKDALPATSISEEIFSSIKPLSVAHEDGAEIEKGLFSDATPLAKNKAHDKKLSADSEIKPGKSKQRLQSAARTKSLFDDDDKDDDLFKTSSTSKSSTKGSTSTSSSTKRESTVKSRPKFTSIFKDEADGNDLFEDPLTGSKK